MAKVDSALEAVAAASMHSAPRDSGGTRFSQRRMFRCVGQAVGAGFVTAVIVAVPTDVLDTPYFTRMTPVRWWEGPVVVLTVLLVALWAGLGARPRARPRGAVGVTSVVVSALAVGCPVCNKIVVALLGVSGALTVWSPVQPILALASITVLAVAVFLRWRATMQCPYKPLAQRSEGTDLSKDRS